ncbi:MAG TPA: lipase family protein [Rhodospirillales bacterium]
MRVFAFRAFAAVFLGAAALAGPASAQYSAFYAATPQEMAGTPGTVIRWEPLESVPFGMKAYRVLYRSTGLQGEPIAVSGVVVVPDTDPAGINGVVAWAHPTTGVADKCAPSLSIVFDVLKTIPGLDQMVKRGYVVASTDYPGLGTAGEHPYLVGISEARAVLDSVRAARQIAGPTASNRFAVWGHSQGGHAALWTGELAGKYAPDLKLVGVAAAAPASLLGELFDDDLGTDAGKGLTALTLWSWSRIYDLDLGTIVEPEDISSVAAIGGQCLAGFTDLVTDAAALGQINSGKFMFSDPVTTPPWSTIITENTPGKLAAGAPVFIAQGNRDTVVDQPVTKQFAIELCNQGTAVVFHEVTDATHTVIADVSAAAAVEWMAARFAGEPAPTNCIKN